MPRSSICAAALVAALSVAGPASAGEKRSCFDGPPLLAEIVWSQLAPYSASQDYWDFKSPLPKTTYGRCKVHDAGLYDPRGLRLAKLHCGIEVERRGLVGPLGLQVGAPGRYVIERTRPGEHQSLVCTAYTGGSRCFYKDDRGNEPLARYIVARPLADGVELSGARAERFFAGQRIVKIFVTMSCH